MRNTTLCYIERDKCYLMMHRTKKMNDPNHDLWLGLGGHFEEGESPEECMIREVREESGLIVSEPKLRGMVTFSDGDWHELMFLFSATDFHGELLPCNEGDLLWVEKQRVLHQLPIWEGDRIFLSLMEQDKPFFSLKLTYSHRRLQEVLLNGKPFTDRNLWDPGTETPPARKE